MDWEYIFKNLKTLNWVILLLLASLSFFLMNEPFTTGIILGGFIIIANFRLLQHTIRQGFSSDGVLRVRKASIIAKYYLRLFAMAIIIYFLIPRHWVHPVGLIIGLSIVVISIISLGIHMSWKTSSCDVT
jgi:hypothetical protein